MLATGTLELDDQCGGVMDFNFWMGLLLGTVINIALMVLAIYLDTPLKSYFERFRITRRLKKLDRERERYSKLLRLRYDSAFRITAIASTIGIMLLLLNLSVLLATFAVAIKDEGIILLAFSFVVSCMLVLGVSELTEYEARIRDFDVYRRQLMEKWPNEEWPETYKPLQLKSGNDNA